MDTDVMVLKDMKPYLRHESFSGFESKEKIPTGIMGSEKENPLFARLLKYYDIARFIKTDGTLDMTTNVETITKILLTEGFEPNGEFQIVSGMALYPQNVFCPDLKKLNDKKYMENTVTIHYFAGSWKSEATKKENLHYGGNVLRCQVVLCQKSWKKYGAING